MARMSARLLVRMLSLPGGTAKEDIISYWNVKEATLSDQLNEVVLTPWQAGLIAQNITRGRREIGEGFDSWESEDRAGILYYLSGSLTLAFLRRGFACLATLVLRS